MKAPASVAEIESFITMLRVACEDAQVATRLEKLLTMADARRQALVDAWVRDMVVAGAPADFVAAIACLADDRIAEQAYAAIYQCRRR